MKKALCLFCILLLCTAAQADVVEDTWVCLKCGMESSGNACATCNEPRGVWACVECGTRNLSGVCSNCGKEKPASLAQQAEDPRMLFALPAVHYLAAEGDAVNLTRLARYYEKGLGLPQDAQKTVSCLRTAGESGYAPAYV
jgi:TPR repeat protein